MTNTVIPVAARSAPSMTTTIGKPWAASGAVARSISEAPKLAKSMKRPRTTVAPSTSYEFVVASTRIANRSLVDLLIPVDFSASRIAMIHPEARCEATSQPCQCTTAPNLAARITSVVVTTGIAAYVATQTAMSSRYGSATVVSTMAHRATATANMQSQAQDAKQDYHE